MVGTDKDVRRDRFGNVIKWKPAKKKDEYDWVMDHWLPHSRGGLSDLSNCEPIQWMIQAQKELKDEQMNEENTLELCSCSQKMIWTSQKGTKTSVANAPACDEFGIKKVEEAECSYKGT